MDFELWYKPGWDPSGVSGIRGTLVQLSDVSLRLHYRAEGELDQLVVPEPGQPQRRNNLWQSTCFELFLKPDGATSYRELNFSPSTAWAAYNFAAHRAGMSQAAVIAAPEISILRGADFLELDVIVALEMREPRYQVGISAIIEERGGRKSYWALNHPSGEPDFHSPDCFALELAPPATA